MEEGNERNFMSITEVESQALSDKRDAYARAVKAVVENTASIQRAQADIQPEIERISREADVPQVAVIQAIRHAINERQLNFH